MMDLCGFSGVSPDLTIYLTTNIPPQTYLHPKHIPSSRNEGQLTNFPCSPALSTSCLFIVSCFNAPTVRLHSICSYQSGFMALRNLEKYAKDALNCRVIRCQTLDRCYFTGTLLFIVQFLRTGFFFSESSVFASVSPSVTHYPLRA